MFDGNRRVAVTPEIGLFVKEVKEIYALLGLGFGLRGLGRSGRGGSLPCGNRARVAAHRGIKIFLQLSDNLFPPSLVIEFLLNEIVLLFGVEGVMDHLVRGFVGSGGVVWRRVNLSRVIDNPNKEIN